MIGPIGSLGAGARVMVATRPVDFRNYAATMIMRSRLCRSIDYGVFAYT